MLYYNIIYYFDFIPPLAGEVRRGMRESLKVSNPSSKFPRTPVLNGNYSIPPLIPPARGKTIRYF